jgi:hypothetical protein
VLEATESCADVVVLDLGLRDGSGLDAIATLREAGGGGMPVAVDADGRPQGVEAVVDKDVAAVVLAVSVGADRLLLLTDVDGVYRGFGGAAPPVPRTAVSDRGARTRRERRARARQHAPRACARDRVERADRRRTGRKRARPPGGADRPPSAVELSDGE